MCSVSLRSWFCHRACSAYGFGGVVLPARCQGDQARAPGHKSRLEEHYGAHGRGADGSHPVCRQGHGRYLADTQGRIPPARHRAGPSWSGPRLPRLLGVAALRGDPRSGESRAAAEHTARTREGPQRRQNYASLFFVVVPGAVWHRCCLHLFVYLLFVHACCMPGLWLDICFSCVRLSCLFFVWVSGILAHTKDLWFVFIGVRPVVLLERVYSFSWLSICSVAPEIFTQTQLQTKSKTKRFQYFRS